MISGAGFDGLVIKNELLGISEEDAGDCVRIIAGAGEDWDGLVKFSVVEKGLYGLENLSLIPGVVGASPVQNIGAYGVEAKDTIEWVELYNPISKKVERLNNAECNFGYRDSIFKHERKNNIILRVAFLLKKKGVLAIEYKDVKNYFAGKASAPSLCNVRDAIIEIRKGKFPDLSKVGTAGSFFKNITIPKIEYNELLKKFPLMPAFPQADNNVKIPTAWILDNVCGFKGLRRGDVGVYEKQALVLLNFGNASAQQVKDLASEMIACVKEKTGLNISPEVEFV